jgi:hypothetical protein
MSIIIIIFVIGVFLNSISSVTKVVKSQNEITKFGDQEIDEEDVSRKNINTDTNDDASTVESFQQLQERLKEEAPIRDMYNKAQDLLVKIRAIKFKEYYGSEIPLDEYLTMSNEDIELLKEKNNSIRLENDILIKERGELSKQYALLIKEIDEYIKDNQLEISSRYHLFDPILFNSSHPIDKIRLYEIIRQEKLRQKNGT